MQIKVLNRVSAKHQGNMIYQTDGIGPTLQSQMGNMSGGSAIIMMASGGATNA